VALQVIEAGFRRDEIMDLLMTLSERHRTAYAIACAERLLPLYQWFQHLQSWGETGALERGIELAWRWVKGGEGLDAEISDAIRSCEVVTPDTEDFDSPLASRALDAASAVAQALETCISPLPETAADAGEIAWECAFGIEQSRVVETDMVHFADRQLLENLAKGGLVMLEEDLQRKSLAWLQKVFLTDNEVHEFRKEFAHFSK
jgi:uncharacterized protein YjaG (DUF416 family)